MENWKFYIVTFGCKVNQYESQLCREAWLNLGGEETEKPEDADYICVNSCAITARAERDARNAINRLRAAAPGAGIILTGCAAQFFEDFRHGKGAARRRPDIRVEQSRKELILEGPQKLLGSVEESEADCLNHMTPNTARHGFHIERQFKRSRAVVKVQDGCVQNCAYCIVPQTRPKLASKAPEKILAECQALIEAGHAEIMISGVNLRLYGKDRPEYGDFWDMLARLDRGLAPLRQGRARLRISSVEPSMLGEKALQTLAQARLICPHLHLSLQHASPKILAEMGRGSYKAEDILDFTTELSALWPVFALGADILVGFPGETEEDIKTLLDFIDASPLSYAHVFPYSIRPGTAAGTRKDQIPQRVRRETAARIRERVNAKKSRFWERLCRLPALTVAPETASMPEKGLCRGVSEFYAPCFMPVAGGLAGLVRVRPVKNLKEGILAERLE